MVTGEIKACGCGKDGFIFEIREDDLLLPVWGACCPDNCRHNITCFAETRREVILMWNQEQEYRENTPVFEVKKVSPTEGHDAYSWFIRNLIKAVGIPKRLLKGKTQGGSDV